MAQLFNIYANIESPLDYPSTRKREMPSSEGIYENVLIHTLEPNRSGSALSGNKHMLKHTHTHTHIRDKDF